MQGGHEIVVFLRVGRIFCLLCIHEEMLRLRTGESITASVHTCHMSY